MSQHTATDLAAKEWTSWPVPARGAYGVGEKTEAGDYPDVLAFVYPRELPLPLDDPEPGRELKARAKLIASAPRLLRMLLRVQELDWYPHHGDSADHVDCEPCAILKELRELIEEMGGTGE